MIWRSLMSQWYLFRMAWLSLDRFYVRYVGFAMLMYGLVVVLAMVSVIPVLAFILQLVTMVALIAHLVAVRHAIDSETENRRK